jgi:hypothetical protein
MAEKIIQTKNQKRLQPIGGDENYRQNENYQVNKQVGI